MGNDRTQHETPDLVSAKAAGGQSSNAGPDTSSTHPSPKPILPKNLSKAIGYLEDQELDRLLEAVIDEVKRRGRLLPGLGASSAKSGAGSSEPIPKRSPPHGAPTRRAKEKIARPSLTRGQVNAVRAAFKAGITPSRIARQFGLTQSDVRRALTADKT